MKAGGRTTAKQDRTRARPMLFSDMLWAARALWMFA